MAENTVHLTNHVYGSDSIILTCHLMGRGDRKTIQQCGRGRSHVRCGTSIESLLHRVLMVKGVECRRWVDVYTKVLG